MRNHEDDKSSQFEEKVRVRVRSGALDSLFLEEKNAEAVHENKRSVSATVGKPQPVVPPQLGPYLVSCGQFFTEVDLVAF